MVGPGTAGGLGASNKSTAGAVVAGAALVVGSVGVDASGLVTGVDGTGAVVVVVVTGMCCGAGDAADFAVVALLLLLLLLLVVVVVVVVVLLLVAVVLFVVGGTYVVRSPPLMGVASMSSSAPVSNSTPSVGTSVMPKMANPMQNKIIPTCNAANLNVVR